MYDVAKKWEKSTLIAGFTKNNLQNVKKKSSNMPSNILLVIL